MESSTQLDKIVTLAGIGEQVVELVRQSGVLRKKPGRKKGSVNGKAAPVKAAAKPKVAPKVVKPKPPVVEEPAPEVDEEED